MTMRWVRIALLLLAMTALAAAAAMLSTAERQVQIARDAARAFDDGAARLLVRVAELRGAQQAYVAAGQGDAFWIARATAELTRLRGDLDAINQLAGEPDAAGPLQAAKETLEDFAALDGRVREYLQSGQHLMASDLIFADGLELLGNVALRIGTARDVERRARDRALAGVRRRGLMTLAGGVGVVLLCLVLLTPAGRTSSGTSDLAPALEALPAAVTVAAANSPAPSAAVLPPVGAGAPPLVGVASLCTDLGRVQDTRELPTLLERAARLLDARGLIVWVGGPGARELRAALSHGYAPAVVGRLGGIATDADNATAAAYRTGRLQVVKGDGTASGAIAAPLVSASGCIGVIAVEFTTGAESRELVQALAAIVAAQLATLVSVAPEPAMRNAELGMRN